MLGERWLATFLKMLGPVMVNTHTHQEESRCRLVGLSQSHSKFCCLYNLGKGHMNLISMVSQTYGVYLLNLEPCFSFLGRRVLRVMFEFRGNYYTIHRRILQLSEFN